MQDTIIIGPSNTGKSYTSNYLASMFSLPIFNCDSVQIYKFLNSLTNKPSFINQIEREGEIISFMNLQSEFDAKKFVNIIFKIYTKNKEGLFFYELEGQEFLGFINDYFKNSYSKNNKVNVENYLFDIKYPLDSYSSYEFQNDIKRIANKFNLKSKIIVGGTIYYAYNYIFQTNRGFDLADNLLHAHKQVDFSTLNYDDCINFLKKNDPEILKIIDVKNPRRVETAVRFIIQTGKKYSSQYFRLHKPLDDFLLIILYPKDREKYYRSLDEVIDKRLNENTFDELNFITKKYGDRIIGWLEKLSYEYKYFLQIYSLIKKIGVENYFQNYVNSREIQEILQVLKFKEHQYAKRQMTFIKKLETKLLQLEGGHYIDQNNSK